VLVVLTTACAGAPIARDRLTDPGALLFNGYTKPDVDCYKCHGGDGGGVFLRGPGLAGRVPSLTPEQITEVIQKGKGFMPSFVDKLNKEEINQIISWLKQTFPPPPAKS
jgi:mono/diheme cytochrome c family protein